MSSESETSCIFVRCSEHAPPLHSTTIRPMPTPGTVVLRRTWPQRLVILLGLGVIAVAFIVAWFINDVFLSISEVGRVRISGEILLTDTVPGEPVNFLLIEIGRAHV